MQKGHLSTGEAAKFFGVHPVTIRRWVSADKLHPLKTPTGKFLFKLDEIFKLTGEVKNDKIVGYTQVSSDMQKNDLERQKELILSRYPDIQIIQDIGIGINKKRRGFDKLIEMVINREIGKVVVTRGDRLTKFEFEILEKFFNSYMVEVEVLNEKITKGELVEDIMAVILPFAKEMME